MAEATTLQGRYRLDARIASGSMGTVYAGTDERLERPVAVKVLKEELSHDPSFVERFRREARAVAALSHPNIANVYDASQDQDRHFMVMELVNGRDLGRIIKEDGALPLTGRPASPLRSVTLAHAHGAGIIHRDIKPGNVIVDEETGRVLVTDFGIARAAGDSTLTGVGAVMGTAHYLAPERATGSQTSESSDLYSVGVVLYEMLTGSLPFRGDSVVEVAIQHVSREVPAPSSIVPEVPPWLDAVVAKATAKDPAERFGNAREMALALRSNIRTSPATAVMAPTETPKTNPLPPLSAPPSRRPPLRKRSVALIAAMVSLAILALGAGTLAFFADDLFGANENPGAADPQDNAGKQPEPGRRGDGGQGSAEPTTTPSAEPTTTPSPEPTATPSPTASSGQVAIREGVIGEDGDEVEDVLEGAGFKVKQEKIPSGQPKETVVGTEPAPGVPLTEGQEVVLFVSKGP